VPQLEHEERPDALRVVLDFGRVTVEQLAYVRLIEVAAARGAPVEQHVSSELA